MEIIEILRRIWLLNTNKIKSSESVSKQPTQLIIEAEIRQMWCTYNKMEWNIFWRSILILFNEVFMLQKYKNWQKNLVKMQVQENENAPPERIWPHCVWGREKMTHQWSNKLSFVPLMAFLAWLCQPYFGYFQIMDWQNQSLKDKEDTIKSYLVLLVFKEKKTLTSDRINCHIIGFEKCVLPFPLPGFSWTAILSARIVEPAIKLKSILLFIWFE